jgi:hypothetical protein
LSIERRQLGGEDEAPEGVKAETLWELIDELSGRGFLVDKLIKDDQ